MTRLTSLLLMLTAATTWVGCAARHGVVGENGGDGAAGGQGGQVGPTERCGNGMDDNGNGQIDEDCPCTAGATQPCWAGPTATRGRGTCSDGTQTCMATGFWGACTG